MSIEERIAELERRVEAIEGKQPDRLMSLREADAHLHVQSGTTAAAIARGELRARRKPGGSRHLVSLEDLEAWRRGW